MKILSKILGALFGLLRKIPFKAWLVIVPVLIIAGCVFYFFNFAGRTPSRLLGAGHAQVLEVKNLQDIVSVSFDKRGSSTVKDVTFLAGDGYYYTQEFRDVSPLEGIIRWVPYDHGSDLIQSRALSRWFGDVVNLKLPKDFAVMKNVDIGYASKSERIKNLVYIAADGRVRCKEYREGFIDRRFEGWLEIRAAE